ncbi:lysophospholipase [Dermabacteraceae bacterium TAE3-ERU5]|nr:lysophospholipase [Dermabacteraceae bacterium TAE3-ERU5]
MANRGTCRELSRPSVTGTLAAASALGLGAAFGAGARYVARQPIVPLRTRRPDVYVRGVTSDHVLLDPTPLTTAPGRYAIQQQGGAIHTRVGEPTVSGKYVRRPIIATDSPEKLEPGPACWRGTYYRGTPLTAHGLAFNEVMVQTPVGAMPAWHVPPGEDNASDDWVIIVHGHGSSRVEALRALPVINRQGLHSLSITYRNDQDVPASPDQLYHLGANEWEDADAAIEYALAQGARKVVVLGYSMGGSIALRLSVHTRFPQQLAGIILDGPAVDWHDILTYHARAMWIPRPVEKTALWMLTSPLGSRLLQLREPLALAEMNPDFYENYLTCKTLLIHSADDAFVPIGPSRDLAARRPDLIELSEYQGAPHICEWNVDRHRWEKEVAAWLEKTLAD